MTAMYVWAALMTMLAAYAIRTRDWMVDGPDVTCPGCPCASCRRSS